MSEEVDWLPAKNINDERNQDVGGNLNEGDEDEAEVDVVCDLDLVSGEGETVVEQSDDGPAEHEAESDDNLRSAEHVTETINRQIFNLCPLFIMFKHISRKFYSIGLGSFLYYPLSLMNFSFGYQPSRRFWQEKPNKAAN